MLEGESTHSLQDGRYQLRDLLGRGGMGKVYRAIDGHSGHSVAVKILSETPESSYDWRTRFQREGQALRRLDHPHIVKILDQFEEQGRHYLVLECLSGGSLSEQKDLPLKRVVELFLALADALTQAHRLGIIHRDLKPDNILIAEDGAVRLTDFGMAHLRGATALTARGAVLGTLPYLSPQGFMGEVASPAYDIWALGVMLFEQLYGRRPFLGETISELVQAIFNQPLPEVEALRPDLPPALNRLVTSMLEKEADSRIGSMEQVRDQLAAILALLS